MELFCNLTVVLVPQTYTCDKIVWGWEELQYGRKVRHGDRSGTPGPGKVHQSSRCPVSGKLALHWSSHLWRWPPSWFHQSHWPPRHAPCVPRAHHPWEETWIWYPGFPLFCPNSCQLTLRHLPPRDSGNGGLEDLNYFVCSIGQDSTTEDASEREGSCALTLKASGLKIGPVPNPLSSMPVTNKIEGKEWVRR